MRLFPILLVILFHAMMPANEPLSDPMYKNFLIEKISQKIPLLSTYPTFRYPNEDYQQLFKKNGRILVFGYGSLMNAASAARSVSPEAIKTMQPVAAFGVKRIFNYKASNVSSWGPDLKENERAMLNIEPVLSYDYMINGIVMEVDRIDLGNLIKREEGYDLVPILVADWNEVVANEKSVEIQIAYTFLAPDELRQGIDYTQTKYYPVRGYLHAVQKGASAFGSEFLDYWNSSTYLGDGTTPITKWNEEVFSGILDNQEP